jgi:hypothetical protein
MPSENQSIQQSNITTNKSYAKNKKIMSGEDRLKKVIEKMK